MKGRVLITGASSGIGLQLARDYLADGYALVVCGRDRDKLLRELPRGKISYRVFDTTEREQVNGQLAGLNDLDIVILNAGNCEYVDDAQHLDAELFRRVIESNLLGTVNCLSALLPNMKAGSQLVIVSSSVTYLPLTRAEAYGASKAALDYLAKTLAVDLHEQGIGVTLVRPGFVDTPLTQRNDFPMPGRVSVHEASAAIRRGVQQGKREINFPWLFISIMKMMSWLPNSLWHVIAVAMRRRAT